MFARLEQLRRPDRTKRSESEIVPSEAPQSSTWEEQAISELDLLISENDMASAYLKARRHHLMGHEWAESYLLLTESSLIQDEVVEDAFEAEER